MVIQWVFEEIANDLKAQGKNVVITNGTENFNSIAESIEKLEIFN
jgi:ADP-heptose:LPS heptosyltransferase